MKVYKYTAPSGVEVTSCVEHVESRIDTNAVLFWLWSEWTWTKKVARGVQQVWRERCGPLHPRSVENG